MNHYGVNALLPCKQRGKARAGGFHRNGVENRDKPGAMPCGRKPFGQIAAAFGIADVKQARVRGQLARNQVEQSKDITIRRNDIGKAHLAGRLRRAGTDAEHACVAARREPGELPPPVCAREGEGVEVRNFRRDRRNREQRFDDRLKTGSPQSRSRLGSAGFAARHQDAWRGGMRHGARVWWVSGRCSYRLRRPGSQPVSRGSDSSDIRVFFCGIAIAIVRARNAFELIGAFGGDILA